MIRRLRLADAVLVSITILAVSWPTPAAAAPTTAPSTRPATLFPVSKPVRTPVTGPGDYISGYIDVTGKVVIPLRPGVGGPFSEGLAPFWEPEGDKWGYIDTTGRYVIKPIFHTYHERFPPFRDGLVRAFDYERMRWGYMDKTGRWAIPAAYDFAADFSGGLAYVNQTPESPGGYVDTTGKMVVAPINDEGQLYPVLDPVNFSEGLACVHTKEGYVVIDTAGKTVLGPAKQAFGQFSEGLSAHVGAVKAGGPGGTGYVDRTGQWVLRGANKWKNPSDFHDGRARVTILPANKTGYIDRQGNIVAGPFASAREFSDGLALVLPDGQTLQFIDPNGKVVIQQGPDWLPRPEPVFTNGLALITTTQGTGYIDKTGKWVWKSWE